MIVADDDRDVGFGFVQVFAEQAHSGDVGVQLSRIFTGGPYKELRRVDDSGCRYDFSHGCYLVLSEVACADWLHGLKM